jgi:hypothetical protein
MTAAVNPNPVNRFDHIRSIIDTVFGPEDDSDVPTAHTMTAARDFTACTSCGNNMPAAAFWLCGPCHQLSLDEAAQEQGCP